MFPGTKATRPNELLHVQGSERSRMPVLPAEWRAEVDVSFGAIPSELPLLHAGQMDCGW